MVNLIKARKNIDDRYESRKLRSMERFTAATHDARVIVTMIASEYRPRRIYQWGSLLHPDRFDENSDIDLAVEGITDAETYFKVLGDAMKLTSFPLDIIQIEKIEAEFAETIRLSGKIVYERS